MASEKHRLHPTSLIFKVIKHARGLLIPGIIVLVLARGGRWQLWLMLLFVPSMLFELIRYLTLRYRFEEGGVVISSGIINRNERHIPYSRIQSIQTVQGVLHRMLKVAEARLDTPGGSTPEATLTVLSLDAIREMRRRVSEGRAEATGVETDPQAEPDAGADQTEQPAAPALVQLGTRELVKLGLISRRGLALVAILIGLAWELDLLDRVSLRENAQALADLDTTTQAWLGAGAIAAIILIVPIVSVVWTIIRLHAFRLGLGDDGFHLSCGLFTRREATIPRRRIQLVSVREGMLHRYFKRVSIRSETAGNALEQSEDTTIAQRWFIPLLPVDQVPTVVEAIIPGLDLRSIEWQSLAPRARRRMIRKGIIVAIVLGAITTALAWPWGLAAIIAFIPLAIWLASAEARRTSYAFADGRIAFRSGIIMRRTTITSVAKIQSVSMTRSPFDRRWGMAGVQVDTAGAGPAGHRIQIPYLDEDSARALASRLASSAERVEFTW